MVLITTILTWIIPQGYFDYSEMVIGDITRVGLYDFFSYVLMGVQYFHLLFTLIFIVGGLYQVLSKIGAYQKLTSSIAKFGEDKEIIFISTISLIFAGLTAIMTEYYVLLVFIPFVITIISKMKLSKFTAFAATFGSILIGIFGSIYNSMVVGMNIEWLSTDIEELLSTRVILFAVAYIVFTIFNVLHIRKTLKDNKIEAAEDIFVNDEKVKNAKLWPLIVVGCLFTLVTIFAYIPWDSVFGIEFFNDIMVSFKEFEIAGNPIFQYILGDFRIANMNEYTTGAFGLWDLLTLQITLLIFALIIKLTYKVKTNDFLTSFGEGAKKTFSMAMLILLAYTVLVLTVMAPIAPVIIDWVMTLTDKFNVFLGVIGGLLTSIFTVEYQYTASIMGSYFANSYSDIPNQIGVLLQTTFGLSGLFAPTSIFLLIGLSYLDISYKEWFKYIWKTLLALLILIIIVMFVII